MNNKIFTTSDNARLMCAVWDGVQTPIGVIQIVHGVFDTATSYDKFAHFLNQNGYIVFSTETVLSKQPRTFDHAVIQEIDILRHLNTKYDLPIFLIGYGYGGFIVQSMLQQIGPESAAACLIKSGRHACWKIKIAQTIAYICTRIYGPNAPAKMINFFTRRHCGKNQTSPIGTYGFYASLLDGLVQLNKKSDFENPVLIICGPHDYTRPSFSLSRTLYNSYRNNDLTHTVLLMYPDIPKGLLLEINCGEIGGDILSFFNNTNSMHHSKTSANDNGTIF